MRKLCVFYFCLFFCLFLSVWSLAASYQAYSSVTPSNGNISLLYETMFNQQDYDPKLDWVGIRTGQYDYSVFYNIDNGSAVRLRYYGVQNGYNIDYYYSKTPETNFSYSRGSYTIVGNTEDSLSCSEYRDDFYQKIMTWSVPFILVVVIFFVFRIRKRSGGVRLD